MLNSARPVRNKDSHRPSLQEPILVGPKLSYNSFPVFMIGLQMILAPRWVAQHDVCIERFRKAPGSGGVPLLEVGDWQGNTYVSEILNTPSSLSTNYLVMADIATEVT